MQHRSRLLALLCATPSLCFAGDGNFAPLLLFPLMFLLAPLLAASLAPKGRYFKTLGVLTIIWVAYLVLSLLFFGRLFKGPLLSGWGFYVYWGATLALLPAVMLLYRFNAAASHWRIRPVIMVFGVAAAALGYFLVFLSPLPATKLFWTSAPSDWADPWSLRHRVAKFVIYRAQLISQPRSQAIALLGEPLAHTNGIWAIREQVSGLWERQDYSAASIQKKFDAQEAARDDKYRLTDPLIYRISVKPWNSLLSNDTVTTDKMQKFYALEYLQISVNDEGIINGVNLETDKRQGADIAPNLLP
jgi:hypothetical protein